MQHASPERIARDEEGTATAPASPPVLVFDGGCVFCRHFAELSELRSGIPGLTIRDGRADGALQFNLFGIHHDRP